ncbi:MAG: NUDIX domain-containing protein [Gammaproteobacteria bacterium]|nr:NUDIX domain-containing protein [Gammaproteobacteria bacterium]
MSAEEIARTLLVMRHGQKGEKSGKGEVLLSDQAKRDAQRMGAWIACQHALPQRIVVSPRRAAELTAEKLAKTASISLSAIERQPKSWRKRSSALLQQLSQLPPSLHHLLVIGSKSEVQALLALLQGTKESSFPAGSLVQFAFEGAWSELLRGGMKWQQKMLAPELPPSFPFPDCQGGELRLRPAYYYRQSAVLPYRIQEGRVEYLMVRSSSGKHWVIPKGIHEPEMSAAESAAKEAMEEAGVRGRVLATAIGSYSYPKWGAECEVELYAMEVTEVVGAPEWEETHRGRSWVSLEKLLQSLKYTQIQGLVEQFHRQLTQG